MSQGSDISNTMSDGTFDELKKDLDDYVIPENIFEDEQQDLVQQPTADNYLPIQCSSLNPQLLHNMPQPPLHEFSNPVPNHWYYTKTNYAGDYNFRLGFERESEKVVKATSWTYKALLKKLFARKGVDIPIRIYLQAPDAVRHQLFLRVFVMFTKPEFYTTVLSRCPNHESSDGRHHILECSNSYAVYGSEPVEGHHWVKFPVPYAQVGQEYFLEFFKFLCLNTCPGGPDRRSFHLVFLLEQNGELVGRQILNVKICTTPGRDGPKEEKKFAGSSRSSRFVPKVKHEETLVQPAQQSVVQPPEQRPVAQPTVHRPFVQPSVHCPVVQPVQQPAASHSTSTTTSSTTTVKAEEDEIFTIQITGRKRYEELLRIKEALDIRDLVPADVLETYRASCPPSGPNWYVQQQPSTSS